MASPSQSGSRPIILVLSPALGAISGVSTHVNLLLACGLGESFDLRHFQVGSEGRRESAPARLLRLFWGPLQLAWRLLRERVELVHINSSLNRRAFWRDLAFLLVARLCGVRVLYQVHGGALPLAFCGGKPIPAGLLRWALNLPDLIVLLAQAEMEAYRAFLPEQHLALVPNAIDPAPFLAIERGTASAPVPNGPRHTAPPLRLVYWGRLSHEKGLREALSGLAQARAQRVRATLVIAGSGPDEAELQALARKLAIADIATFVGPVFGNAKPALLAGADVQLLPTYAEGLPYALLEGMAAGLPAITTRVGGIPDVVVEGVHGLFVPVGDSQAIAAAIAQLAADREKREAMAAACRRRIRHSYSCQRLADDFSHIYQTMLTSPNPHRLESPWNLSK